MQQEAYYVIGRNKRHDVEIYQPNIHAARVTKQRLIDEGLTDVRIEFWNYNDERSTLD